MLVTCCKQNVAAYSPTHTGLHAVQMFTLMACSQDLALLLPPASPAPLRSELCRDGVLPWHCRALAWCYAT